MQLLFQKRKIYLFDNYSMINVFKSIEVGTNRLRLMWHFIVIVRLPDFGDDAMKLKILSHFAIMFGIVCGGVMALTTLYRCFGCSSLNSFDTLQCLRQPLFPFIRFFSFHRQVLFSMSHSVP